MFRKAVNIVWAHGNCLEKYNIEIFWEKFEHILRKRKKILKRKDIEFLFWAKFKIIINIVEKFEQI